MGILYKMNQYFPNSHECSAGNIKNSVSLNFISSVDYPWWLDCPWKLGNVLLSYITFQIGK